MAQNFYTKWQDAILADAGAYVSKEYRSFQTALAREISKYATAVGAKVTSNSKEHYSTSCFVERNGKFVYISHSSTLSRMDLSNMSVNDLGWGVINSSAVFTLPIKE